VIGGRKRGGRLVGPGLVETSPLRPADPRVKLAISLCASLAVMMPLARLAVFMAAFAILLGWGRLLARAGRQIWRLKWVLGVLFVVDWLVIGPDLAIAVTLRLVLLAGVFVLFFATTSPAEMCLALEWMRLPYRYAFSVSLAFQSVDLLSDEWLAVCEAQRGRGAWTPRPGWRNLVDQVRDLVALSVPAIVLTTKRAWAMTEAAYARGFDSPHRRPYAKLTMCGLDWWLLAGTAAAVMILLLWRGGG
jgi:energy-coupling factor transport system permease protein